MQSSVAQQRQCTRGVSTRRAVPFTVARPAGRCLSVKVEAKKGKNRGALRQSAGVTGQSAMMTPGAPQQVMVDAKVPEVDPEQVEWVLFVRATNIQQGKITLKETAWFPLSIVRGGPAGTTLSKLMETGFGRKLYSNLLIRQIAQSIYKDRESIASQIRKGYPPFAEAPTKNFQFAFKVRDKTRPEAWKVAEGLTVLPPESDVQGTGFDQVKAFFSADNLSKMFSS